MMIGQAVHDWFLCKGSRGIKEKKREDLIIIQIPNYA
jgi:hypothetical protein